MEFKGTKGEWRAVRNDDDGYDIELIESQPSFGVTFIAREICQGHDEGLADAQLMATAHKMLEAMQEFVDRCDRGEVRSKKTYAQFKSIIAEALTV